MVTKDQVLALFAAYPNNNQNTVREFIDLIFSLTPPPGGYLPLSGGTMTGILDMGNNAPIINVKGLGMTDSILMNNNGILNGSLQSLQTSTLTINAILFSSPTMTDGRLDMVHVGGHSRFQYKCLTDNNRITLDHNELILENQFKGFYFIGSDLAYNNLNKFHVHSNYCQVHHQTGDVLLQAVNGNLAVATNKLGFFNVAPVVRASALTALDTTSLAVELAAFPLTLAAINNLRTRSAETELKLQEYGLFS